MPERYIRQSDIVPAHKLETCSVSVVGVGAIGRQLALQLAALGISKMQLVDPDTVELLNLPLQGYNEQDIGEYKVNAARKACLALNSDCEITVEPVRWATTLKSSSVMFVCVDSISVREFIWNKIGKYTNFWCDGRMLGTVIRVLASTTPHNEYYASTLFAQSEALPGRCTAKGVIYTGAIASGLMTSQLVRWLNDKPVYQDILFNLDELFLDVDGSPQESTVGCD